jgi:signal transduction histidine kinase
MSWIELTFIRVTTSRNHNDNKIIVKIKDTGTGIHPDTILKLFTKFATKSDTGERACVYLFLKV